MSVNACSIHSSNGSSYGLVYGYNGIPENIVINLIYFSISMVVFLFIRRYIRDQDIDKTHTNVYGIISNPKSITELNIKDLNPFTVFWKTIVLSLHDVGQKCGPDSSRYLYFQLHLIAYSIVLCILAIGIVLPVNFQGTLNGNMSNFGFSTISNLPAGSNYLWAPIIVNAFAATIGLLIMIHFVYTGDVTSKDRRSKKTLMIKHVEPKDCNVEQISNMLGQICPDVNIEDITIAHKIWRLNKIIDQSEKIRYIVSACDEMEQEIGSAGPIYHCCCGYYFARLTCEHCTYIKQSDASSFYKGQLVKRNNMIDSLAQEALNNPTGVVFVQFANEDSAKKVYDLLGRKALPERFKGFFNQRNLSETNLIDHVDISKQLYYCKKWKTVYAPKKDNIFWQNVRNRNWIWWLRIAVLNISLFWLAFVLTTPSMVLNTIDKMLSTTIIFTDVNSLLPVFIVNILPPLLLKMISKVLPPVIGHSSHLERHLTRSRKAKSHIHKAFNFLLFTVLIIPSLGLTGINGFLRWLLEIDSQIGADFQWQCIFLPDNGAFFVNYVITSALIGTSTSLLRLPELFSLGLNLLFSKSKPQQKAIYRLERTSFTYCSSYASLLTVFAVVCTYSMICPLITVFGIVYFILNFFVDKYNIYFVAEPTFVKQRIHLAAFQCSLTCLLIPQIFLLIFIAIKSGSSNEPQLIVQSIITTICLFLFVMRKFIQYTKVGNKFTSPLIEQVTINISLDDKNRAEFKRYYANYLLPYVGELTLSEQKRQDLKKQSSDNENTDQ